MTNIEIFHFTGKCLTLDENPEFRNKIIEMIETDSIDWHHFVMLCSNHLILPVIHLKFQSHGITKYLPEELADHLNEIYNLNAKRNKLIRKQLQEITGVLNKNKIKPLFLKGTGNLLDGLYSNIGERILGDIDFLVPEKDYLLSAKLMEDEGYLMVSPSPDYVNIKNIKHYPRLYHPEFEAVIEIHRLPVRESNKSWFNPEIIDREKKEIALLPGCFVQSDQHKIIHNFIHSQLSNEGHLRGIVSFRDLYDLNLLSKRSAVTDTLPKIKCKQKAIVYFIFAGNVLGLRGKFYPGNTLSSRLFSTKHGMNLSSVAFYHTHKSILFLGRRIFAGYIGQFIKSFYSRKMRQYVIDRLTNRSWYTNHLNLYKNFFRDK